MRRFFIFTIFFFTSVHGYGVVNFNFEKTFSFHSLVKSQFETGRLFLIPGTKEDHCELAELLLDHEVTKYMGVPNLNFKTRAEALKFLQEQNMVNFFVWTIKMKDKTSIGQIGVSIDQNNCVDIGYWLGKKFWKQGFAREACIFLCDKIFECFDVRFLRVFIREDNFSSIKLARIIFSHIEKNYGEGVEMWEYKYWIEDKNVRYLFLSLCCKKSIFLS
ncbi:MAG: GNAT family N-acetyltransferase [Cytophagales bacterium]|jgi:RimJ/RimL family protein N-acetyltransferase|nr:GNAT family N-acetyltransferase [Cytophagales bacterium]